MKVDLANSKILADSFQKVWLGSDYSMVRGILGKCQLTETML